MPRTAPRKREGTTTMAQARISKGLTQAQLASVIGCLPKDISRWEHGLYRPRVETAIRIAEALGVKPEELYK